MAKKATHDKVTSSPLTRSTPVPTPPVSTPQVSAPLRAISPPDGFVYYQFVAVSEKCNTLIFSNNGSDWFSYDGLPVK